MKNTSEEGIFFLFFLSHLRFADDIILIKTNKLQLQTMLSQLNNESQKIGLKMNLSKTKIMTNIDDDTIIKIGNDEIKIVENYVYLGHNLKLGLGNQTAEVRRRVGLGWAAFE